MQRLIGSVGRGGVNIHSDVVKVQTLLNRHLIPPVKLLAVDGLFGQKTLLAIDAFQQMLGIENPDGRVDPCAKTWMGLLSAPGSVQELHVRRNVKAFRVHSLSEKDPETAFHSKPKVVSNARAAVLTPEVGAAIAWGARVSSEFKKRVIEIGNELGISPDYLMSCMALETGETFRADVRNPQSSATGLIQFLQATARDLHTTVQDLAQMTPVEQLKYVRLYFLPYKGRLRTLEDVYMAILCPAAIGKGENAVVYKSDGKGNYEMNKGFDKSPHDGKITVQECSSVLRAKLRKGLQRGYYG